jgi:hypothetical protein
MANGKQKSEWIQTANIMTVIFNANVQKKDRKDPIEFMPPELRDTPAGDDKIKISMGDFLGMMRQVKPQ